MNSFINKILFRDHIKNNIFFLTLYFISFFEYLLIVVLNNYSNSVYNFEFNANRYIISLTLLLFIYLAVYINMFIIEDSHKQIAIIMINGKSRNWLTKQIMKSYLLIFLISVVLGSSSGSILIEFILKRNISVFTNCNITAYYKSFCYIILLFMIKSIYIFFYNMYKLQDVKFNLVTYINNISKKEVKVGYFSSFIVEKEKKKFPYVIFSVICFLLLLFIGSFKIILMNDISSSEFFVGFLGTVISYLILSKLLLPLLFDFYHKYLLNKKVWFMVFNDYLSLYKFIFPIMSLSTIFQPIIVYILMISDSKHIFSCIFCYLVTQIVLMLCFFFRYYLYLKEKKGKMMTLKSLGYTVNSIQKILHRELITFIIHFIFSVLFLIIILTIKSEITINKVIIIYIIFFLPVCLLYVVNKLMINKNIKEIINYAHEFNRNT